MSGTVQVGARVQAVSATVRVVGAALLAASGAIHLHLYDDGYRTIATIGPLFLLNAVVAFALTVAVLLAPRRWLPWVALAGGLFLAGALGALFLSLTVGLFGFEETTQAPFVGTTILVESVGALVLLAFAVPTVLRLARAVLARRRG